MKKKILAMMLSLIMVLNTFSVAGAAEFEFTDGEVAEAAEFEEVVFDDTVVVEDNAVPVAEAGNVSDVPLEPVVETAKIGDNATATITYVYEEIYEPGRYYKVPSEVVISGTGDTWDYLEDGYDDDEGSNKNPFSEEPFWDNSVTFVIENGITSIGDRLFAGCIIESITIPESVKSIGKATFKNTAFQSDVVLSENIVELGESAFASGFFLGESKLIQDGIIETIPDCAFQYCRNLKAFDFSGVKKIGNRAFENTNISIIEFTDSLTEIGSGTFEGCTSIQSIKIPDSVKRIGGQAFRRCTALTDVTLPNSELVLSGAFQACIGLQYVIIPEKVLSIEESFHDCSRLLSITIKGNKTEMGEFEPFENCPRLQIISGYDCSYAKKYADTREEIEFKSLGTGAHEWLTDKTIDKQPNCTEPGSKSNHCAICGEKRNEEEILPLGHEWGNAVIIKEPTESEEGLKRYTCWRCGEIKDEKVPPVGQVGSIQVGDDIWATISGDTLTLSGDGATWDVELSDAWYDKIPNGKENIKRIEFEDNKITYLGNDFFNGFKSIESIELPNSLTKLGYCVFENCSSLKNLQIPEGVISMGGGFEFCDALESITFPSTLNKIPTLGMTGPQNLKTVVIPEGVQEIAEEAFCGCESLENIKLPSTITSIGNSAFARTGITNFNWPKQITVIPGFVFGYCEKLTEFTVPETVTSIEDTAFQSCANLKNITIPKTVTYFGRSVFYDCRNLTIRGYRDSAAERYANNNYIPFVSVDFKVVFKEDGRTIGEPQYIEAGEDATPPPVEPREGYTLSWDADYTNIQEDMIINAVWTKNDDSSTEPPIIIYPPEETKYTVTFKDRGKTIKTEKVKSGEAADIPYIDRYGYELSWDKDFSNVTSNMTVNAVWTIIEPAKVTNLTGEIISKKISLSWDESEYAGYYKIYRKASSDEKFTLVARTSQTLWNDRRAKTGVEYEYKAIAVRSVGGELYTSSESDVVTVKLGAPEVGRIYTVGNLNYKVMTTSEVRVTGAAKVSGSVYIPNTVTISDKVFEVTSIDHKAFYKNENIVNVRIGNYVTYVGQYSFYRCPNLKSVRFGKNVEVISTCAFTECPKLGNIVLPEKVKRLGAKVFYHCPNLKTLYIKTNYLEYIGKKGLAIDRSTVIKVPSRKYSAYKKMIEDSVKFSATKIVKL